MHAKEFQGNKLPKFQFIKHNLGVYFMLVGCFSFAAMGAFAKLLSDELSSIEVMFFRNLVSVFFMLYSLSLIAHKKHGGRPFLLVFRGVCGTVSLYCFFYNVSHISLGGAFAFQKTNPLFVALIAFLLLGERLKKQSTIALFVAFLGVLIISSPSLGAGFDLKNSLLGIASGFFAAIALTSMRELSKSYNTQVIALSFFLAGVIMPIISMILGEFASSEQLREYDFAISTFIMPHGWQWLYIAAMGFCSFYYQLCVTKAYRASKKAGVVAGVSYMDVVFTLLLGIAMGDGMPSAIALAGIGLILGGGLFLAVFKG